MAEQAQDRAVDAALSLFWDKGAEVAAYPDIVAATGLSRKALYQRWPDKDNLISDTLRHYQSTVLDGMIGHLQGHGIEALEQFWTALGLAVRQEGWRGCYLFRTASGPFRDKPFVAQSVNAHLDRMIDALTARIAEASAEGVSYPFAPDVVARQVMAVLVTISVMGAQAGYTPFIAAQISAGRLASGLDASQNTLPK